MVLFLKASTALSNEPRWITLHPHGRDLPGQPVLIQPQPDGSAKVIGGAGGALSHLRLTGVKSEAHYKDEARSRAQEHRAKAKQRQAQDKQDGIAGSKARAQEVIRAQLGDEHARFIQAVAQAAGWQESDLAFPEHLYQNASEPVRRKAQKKHAAELLRRAKAVIDRQRQILRASAEARAEAKLGEIALTSTDADRLDVTDLDPVSGASSRSLGFQANYGKRAAGAGLAPDELRREVQENRAIDPERAAAQAEKRRVTAEAVAQELREIRDPGPQVDPAKLEDTRQAVELLKAAKRFQQAQKSAQEQRKAVDSATAPVEPTAYVLETGKAPEDSDVLESIEQDLRTASTRMFLEAAAQTPGGLDAMGRHIAAGAFNSVNALALAAGGNAMVDRSVVDVLGIAGAAQVLARRLHADLSPEELSQTAEAMETFHKAHYMATADEAIREARDWQEMASEIELGEAARGADLASAQELNARRRELIGKAQTVMGTAYGEMEANAALVLALKQGPKKALRLSMGETPIESAIQQLRAIGLERGDYQVERVGTSTLLEITGEGMGRLAQPVSREDASRVQTALGIMRGDRDEEGWLPEGVARRPDLSLPVEPGVAPRLAKPFPHGPADVRQAMEDYIGGRAADGDTAAEIVRDLLTEDLASRAGNREAYTAALNALAPAHDAEGKQLRAEDHQERFQQLADEYVRREYGADRSPLHRQRVAENPITADALHRALAQHPEGVLAFRPTGDLTPQDQGALRAEFAKVYGQRDAETDAMVEQLRRLDADAPEKYLPGTPEGYAAWESQGERIGNQLADARERDIERAAAARQGEVTESEETRALRQARDEHLRAEPTGGGGLFGSGGRNPEWNRWAAERDRLAEQVNGRIMTWAKYTQTMGGPTNAYATMQDIVRSRVLRAFADQYNALQPGQPIKVGFAPLANELSHLDATDHEARERRLKERERLTDSLRERVQGRYAAGKVADKLEAAREEQAALEEAQMGLFGGGGGLFDDGPDLFGESPKQAEKAPEAPKLREAEKHERYSLGHQVERQLAGLAPVIGRGFEPGKPVKIWQATMDGRFAGRQRAVKLIKENRRTGLGLGVGSGKTSISLSAFTDLKAEGKVQRGLFVVPSVVQGQFAGEALTLLEPGRYKWHIDPGASREERIAGYKDKTNDFSVVTHQAFRDDLLHMASAQHGTTPEAIAVRMDEMTAQERSRFMRDVLDKEGIDHDYVAIDEGHNLLNRQGKANSRMANAIDAVTDSAPYYVSMTADPVKNDVSEAFDALAKMDRERYSDRDAFMRRYGVNTPAAKDALRRELARHYYTGRIESGIQATKHEVPIELTEAQRTEIQGLDHAAAAARIAGIRGGVDVTAMKVLAPGSFRDVPPEREEEVARELSRFIGPLYDAAVGHAVNGGAKTEAVAAIARQHRGKPGVVFARRLERVEEVAARLRKQGLRVATLTGADSSKDKDAKKRGFQSGQYDVMVASDAGAVGANLQAGKWLVQYDTPLTAMLHKQRDGRIDRMGQSSDVDLYDLVANHPSERKARARLAKKQDLRDIVTSPLDGLDDSGLAGMLNRIRAMRQDTARPVFGKVAEEEREPEGQHALL